MDKNDATEEEEQGGHIYDAGEESSLRYTTSSKKKIMIFQQFYFYFLSVYFLFQSLFKINFFRLPSRRPQFKNSLFSLILLLHYCMHCHIGHSSSTPHCLHFPKVGRESGCAKTESGTDLLPEVTLNHVLLAIK